MQNGSESCLVRDGRNFTILKCRLNIIWPDWFPILTNLLPRTRSVLYIFGMLEIGSAELGACSRLGPANSVGSIDDGIQWLMLEGSASFVLILYGFISRTLFNNIVGTDFGARERQWHTVGKQCI